MCDTESQMARDFSRREKSVNWDMVRVTTTNDYPIDNLISVESGALCAGEDVDYCAKLKK